MQGTERRAWRQWAELTEGAYILRSNVSDWTPEELWQTYVHLWQAEAAFRIHKSELSIRPIWHQCTERVDALILVCFLAFAMWKTLQGWQRQAGLGDSPRTLLEELKLPGCRSRAPRSSDCSRCRASSTRAACSPSSGTLPGRTSKAGADSCPRARSRSPRCTHDGEVRMR